MKNYEPKDKFQELVSWLRLLRSRNIGPRTFWQLLERYKSPQAALAALPQLSRKGGGEKYAVLAERLVLSEIEETRAFGAEHIAYFDPRFPKQLKDLADCPPVIIAKGNIELLSKLQLAIVGSRNSSAVGGQFAFRLACDLAKAGYGIVSGLARGIDSFAHRGALRAGTDASTVAVIAGGIDHIYPKENKELYGEIFAKGVVITESPIGSKPLAQHFPQRNRLISGLAKGVVIVEAAKKSGTLITAKYALEQGREVFAVPGSPMDPRCQGTNDLIKEGAYLADTADNIIQIITNSSQTRTGSFTEHKQFTFRDIHLELDEDIISQYRELVYAALSFNPINIDDLADFISVPAPIINWLVLELEVAGKAVRSFGNRVALKLEESNDDCNKSQLI
jgi:DNA processing protein